MKKHIKLFEDMFVGSGGDLGNLDDTFGDDGEFSSAEFDTVMNEVIKDAENEIQKRFSNDPEQQQQAREEISQNWTQAIMQWASQ